MKNFFKSVQARALQVILLIVIAGPLRAQPFIHPGIDQQAKDLAYMKKMVLEGKQPWKAAFDKLKAATDTNFSPKPHAHVLRGPFGKPNIGGDDLSRSASMAYNCALLWYITNDKTYAAKAIEILNAWSPVLWDFDYNDAKLLASWTGHQLCNAAEILRYTHSGWQQKDIAAFTNMLMTVYYPLLRYYYPQANGNWDGALIHTLLAMGIFTDNRKIFDNAVDHFLHGPVNGSIFKYIYPSGQCQESPRDQGHVQLGIGEFAGAAQAAYTQGVDFFSIADNRIALGFEYEAQFLLGQTPQCYCVIAERAKVLRDDYEYVYRHYTAHGVDIPWIKKAADSVRSKASRSVLTSVRLPSAPPSKLVKLTPSTIGYVAGAGAATAEKIPDNAIIVSPGQSIQQALDQAAGTGKWVLAKAGIHTLPATLKIPAGTTLCGEGLATVLFLNPPAGREAMINANDDVHDITIRDLVIEGSNRTEVPTDPNSIRSFKGGYNRAGIIFRSLTEGQMKHISFVHITIRNCTFSGLTISGGSDVNVIGCDFTENGAIVPPGQRLLHNLSVTHCDQVTIKDSRLVTSPFGSGVALDYCNNVTVSNCEIARNGWYGVLIAESKNILIKGNLIEANDRSGVVMEFLHNGTDNINVNNNIIHYNAGYGVESYASKNSKVENNKYTGNGKSTVQQKISNEKYIIME